MTSFDQLLSPGFMPHGYCYMWKPGMVWLHVISDGLIAIAYYCIPIILIYFIRKNRNLLGNRIFWMFAAFILACGTTHAMEIWNIWHANYFIAGLIKAVTAAVSLLTAAMLIPLFPRALVIPEELDLQTETLRSVLDSMNEGLIVTDADGKFVIWNGEATKLLGREMTALPSTAWTLHYGLFMNDTVTHFPTHQMPLLRALHGEVTKTEMFVRNESVPKGRYLEVYGNPRLDKKGAICGSVVAFRDITRFKEDERQIRELNDNLERRVKERTAQLEELNEELYSLKFALDHHALVAITDSRGIITYANDRFCRLSKYSREELIGQDHRILNSGFHPKPFFGEMYGTITRGRSWHGVIRNRAKDGSFYWVDTSIVPIFGAQAEPRGYISIHVDVTEIKKVHEELLKVHEQSEEGGLRVE